MACIIHSNGEDGPRLIFFFTIRPKCARLSPCLVKKNLCKAVSGGRSSCITTYDVYDVWGELSFE